VVDNGQMKKLRLAIVSERTRYHFQKPLESLKEIEVFHLYKCAYSDMDVKRFKNLIPYRNIFDLKKKLQALQPDLVQGLEPYYGYSRFRIPLKILPILFATQSFCKKTGTPYFFHVLENITPRVKYGSLAGAIMQRTAKRYAQGAQFIYYLNEGAKRNLIALGQQSKIRFGLWGIWGVDVDEFRPNHVKPTTILFVGRLSEQKGIMDFIDAVEMLDLKGFDVKIAGEGPLEEEVLARIKASSLGSKISLLGSIPSHEIAGLFKGSYVFVSPYKSIRYSAEQIGMANIEAMACGVPVVGYRAGSVGEFVVDKKTGFLVEEGDIEGLSRKIKEMLESESLRNDMSKNARDLVLEKYNALENAKKLEAQIIKSL